MGSLLVSRVLPASTSARRRLVGSSTRRLVDSRVRSCHAGPGKGESAKALRALCLAVACGSSLSDRGLAARLSFAKGARKRPAEIGSAGRRMDASPRRCAERRAPPLSFPLLSARRGPLRTQVLGPRRSAGAGPPPPRLLRSALSPPAAACRSARLSRLAFGHVGSWARGLVGSALRRRETREDRNYNTDRAPSSSSQLHSPPHDPMTRSPLKEDGSSSERSSSPAGLVGSWASLSPRCSKSSDRFHRCCNCRLIAVPLAQSRSRLPDDDALTSTGTVCYSLDPIPTVVFKSEQRRQMCK